MASEWSNLGLDLHLDLDTRGGRRMAIEQGLREAIRSGRLAPGVRLPATRALAKDLGVARGTVAEAYSSLIAEGFLMARQGSGTTVAPGRVTARTQAPSPVTPHAPPRYDLRVGLSDAAAFPRAAWTRSLRRALRDAPATALEARDARGQPALREALTAYLGRARGVVTSPDRIIVTSGFQQAAVLVFDALQTLGARSVGLEDPCMIDLRTQAERSGLRIVPLPVDADGAQLVDADALMVTPAHQFPLGPTLVPQRRAALVEWARERDAFIVEDDYDGEFRYDRQPVGALQGLDPERVVYAGTASKTLAPGVRVGWLALPERLVEPVRKAKILADRVTSALDQLALAEMLRSGGFDAHLRRMRARYRRRRDMLLGLVEAEAPQMQTMGIAAGLHLVLLTGDEDEYLARAERVGLSIAPLSPMWHDPAGKPQGLVAGYGASPEHAYEASLAALGKVLGDDRAG